jgi:L-aspartate oxidase
MAKGEGGELPQQFDVIVVGAGVAGLYAALCLPEQLQIGLVSKAPLTLSASGWAQGGIAAVMGTEDSFADHIEDTLRAGAGLCDRTAVEFLVKHAPECIQHLLQLGVEFDRAGFELALTLEAGHSHRRILHAADATGRALLDSLLHTVSQRANIHLIPQGFVLDLWLHAATGHCLGVCLYHQHKITWVAAGAVILATGGGGQVFAQTTNPQLSTGDGVAIAWRAGAILQDLEFFQFHPTALFKAGAPRFLISEAVRGEGAHLVDDAGQRFAFHYHPSGELAPRDVVSRAIFLHLQQTTDPATSHVWLDLTPIPPEKIQRRFPNIVQVCQHWGIDVFHTLIPVAPAAHYWMGGIATDLQSQTSIASLYAVGETASTGVHGANRLASNSLLECLVFGRALAKLEVSPPIAVSLDMPVIFDSNHDVLQDFSTQVQTITAIRTALPRIVWQGAGICRDQAGIKEAIAQVKTWKLAFANLPCSQYLCSLKPEQSVTFQTPTLADSLQLWGETRNLLDIAHLILHSALLRRESRGGHYRRDYDQPSPDWQFHTLIQDNRWWQAPLR